jgi:hypothetical protein
VFCPYSIKFSDFLVPMLNANTDDVKLLFVKKLSRRILRVSWTILHPGGAYNGVIIVERTIQYWHVK